MSCGHHHDTPCDEVLREVYLFIDGEMGHAHVSYTQVEAHLHECGPCLAEYDLERLVREIVARSCRSDHASAALRARVLAQLQQIRGQLVTE